MGGLETLPRNQVRNQVRNQRPASLRWRPALARSACGPPGKIAPEEREPRPAELNSSRVPTRSAPLRVPVRARGMAVQSGARRFTRLPGPALSGQPPVRIVTYAPKSCAHDVGVLFARTTLARFSESWTVLSLVTPPLTSIPWVALISAARAAGLSVQ